MSHRFPRAPFLGLVKAVNMPLWGAAYFILFVALCCAGIYLDVKRPEPVWYTLADTLSAASSATAIWAFWHPPTATTLGGLLFVTTGYALLWDSFSLEHDLRHEFPVSDLSPEENRIGVLLTTAIGFAFALPAYYFGFITAYDQVQSVAPTA